MNTEYELLLAKHDVTLKRYVKTGQRHLPEIFFDISNIAEEKLEMGLCAFMNNKVNDILNSNKNF